MSMKVQSLLVLVVVSTLQLSTLGQAPAKDQHEVVELWQGVAPGSEDFDAEEQSQERGTTELGNRWITNISRPTLSVFLPPRELRTGSAVVICPGGGYAGLAFDKEGVQIAQWFNAQGVAAFVLKFRCGGAPHQHPIPLKDAQRAMRIVRHRAAEWQLQPDRIGVMGFSAGGHLASTLGTHFDQGDLQASKPLERTSCRPDFLVLIYPVISLENDITHRGSREHLLGTNPDKNQVRELSNHLQVHEDVPPTFLVHAGDDQAVPVENSLQFYRAVNQHKIAAELHIFAAGGHGFGMRLPQKTPAATWPALLAAWLKEQGVIR